jgi:ABC-type antimicrobial peptide transport system permease subunit
VPLIPNPERDWYYLRVIGRLAPGIIEQQARTEMNGIAARLAQAYPNTNRDQGVEVDQLSQAAVSDVRQTVWVLLGAVAFVLLIACTNVANLMLARSAARQRELAVRAALGAGRARLIQQLLTESAVLGLAGGALGLCLASWTASFLAAVLASNFPIPRIETTRTDAWVLGFTLVVSLATAMVFGTLHAVGAAPPDLQEGLRESGRSAT